MFSLWTNRLVFCLSHLAFMEQLNGVRACAPLAIKPHAAFSWQILSNNFVRPSSGHGKLCPNHTSNRVAWSKDYCVIWCIKKYVCCCTFMVFKSLHSSSNGGSLLGRKITTSCSILLCKHNLCNWWTLMGFLRHSLSCNSHFKSTCALLLSTERLDTRHQ